MPLLDHHEDVQKILTGADQLILNLQKVDVNGLGVKLKATDTGRVGNPTNTSVIGNADEVVIRADEKEGTEVLSFKGSHLAAILGLLGMASKFGRYDQDSSLYTSLWEADAMDDTADMGYDKFFLPIALPLSKMKKPQLVIKLSDPLTYFAGATSGPSSVTFDLDVVYRTGSMQNMFNITRIQKTAELEPMIELPSDEISLAVAACHESSWGGETLSASVESDDGVKSEYTYGDEWLKFMERVDLQAIDDLGDDFTIVTDLYHKGGYAKFKYDTSDETVFYILTLAGLVAAKENPTTAEIMGGKASVNVQSVSEAPTTAPLAGTSPIAPRNPFLAPMIAPGGSAKLQMPPRSQMPPGVRVLAPPGGW